MVSQDGGVTLSFVCQLPHGLHARPASHMSAVALEFLAEATLMNARTGAQANVQSVLSLIAADVRLHDECSIRIQGDDQNAMAAALERLISSDLAVLEAPASAPGPSESSDPIADVPPFLRSMSVTPLYGIPVSRGIASGVVVPLQCALVDADDAPAGDPDDEQRALDRALAVVSERITRQLETLERGVEADILAMHRALVDDLTLAQELAGAIRRGRSARQAVIEVGASFAETLRGSDNLYLRDRALDLRDVTQELLRELSGPSSEARDTSTDAVPTLREPSVLVAEHVTPRQLLALDRTWLRGVVLAHRGTTSHTVILARALGIPTIVGIQDVLGHLAPDSTVVVDAARGFVLADASEVVQRMYAREHAAEMRRNTVLARAAQRPGMTADGRRLEIGANIAACDEIEPAFAHGADGIGLLRTEISFMDRPAPPSEDEQFEFYARAVRTANGRPVIIRTLDIGGDKPLPYVSLADERNPFLGVRGVRVYAAYPELVRTHLRAIVRASAVGRVQLMIPMVSSVDEVVWLKAQIAEVQRELHREGVAFDVSMPIGAMIEVPAAALSVEALAAELDFFSIGTNDLSQYVLASDRDNPGVSALASVRHPGFLRLLQQVVRAAREQGKWIGVCGEMAADPRHLPLFVGLGVNEISVAPTDVPALKAVLTRLSSDTCADLLSRVLSCARTAEVDALLAKEPVAISPQLPLIDADLVVLADDSATKAEVIHALVSALFVAGRTDSPDAVEEAVLAREATYSTGLGYGIAIPHCRTDAVRADSIVALTLSQPVDWGSVDGVPVRFVLLLATRASESNARHLQVFSGLARKLMHASFRERLLACDDAAALVTCLSEELRFDPATLSDISLSGVSS